MQSNALTHVQRQRAVAGFDVLGKNDLLDRLTSRSIPNQRLVNAFNIDNSFTTVDLDVHKRFITSTRDVIGTMNPQRWTAFFAVSEAAVRQAHGILSASHDTLPLAITVQYAVFSTMIYQFFGVILSDTDFDDIVESTSAINNLWQHSKNITSAGQELREEQERLQASLRRLLPDCFPCSSEKHPLNIIIPAYETMWRVILLTFVSAGFRGVDLRTTEQFHEILQNIPAYSGSQPVVEITNTARNFAKEGLRLYPPTRRIHRAIPNAETAGGLSYVKADIEWCHRNKRIWGADAEQFRPSRFQNCTANMDKAYMPFGIGRHRCPTATRFSYHVIVIIVVALAKRLGTKETGSEVIFNDPRLDRNPKRILPSGRMDMDSWVLKVRETE
ncbi:cytochrome P450 [Rostrohypoxylon terebratum]|nr:cytochrome P450 [Rostrohypoxylon terebratum]